MSRSSELLLVVDSEIGMLQQKMKLMDSMHECVRKGSLDALEELIEQEAVVDGETKEVERQMVRLCREIGATIGVPSHEATLGHIARRVPGPDGIALRDRRQRLVVAVQQLQEKSADTAFLVQQALEVNERLLAALLGTGQTDTYNPRGPVGRARQGVAFQHSV